VMSATTPMMSRMTVRFSEPLPSVARFTGMRLLASGGKGRRGIYISRVKEEKRKGDTSHTLPPHVPNNLFQPR
jgi:hypothetical protein